MTSATDNRTTELRKLLDECGVVWEAISDTRTYVGETQLTEYEPGIIGLQMRNLTPEQAIAATLGSEHEAELVKTINDVLRYATDTVWVGEAETLADRMVSLGVYGHEVYEGVRPWEVD